MLKKSLFIGTFFLLFIGLSDYGYACHKGQGSNDKKGCEGGGDDSGNNRTPVVVTFDDWEIDSIQSDHDEDNPSPRPYKHDGLRTGLSAFLNGQFEMVLRQRGIRKLFINFGPLVDCNTGDPGDKDGNPPFGDCVRDARFDLDPENNSLLGIVECPFPLLDPDGNDFRTPPDSPPGSCSALVQAVLTEHDVFQDEPTPEVVLVEDMMPVEPESCADPDRICGPVMKVRSNFVYDIAFTLRRSAKGVKTNQYRIAFNAKQESCSDAAFEAGLDFPDYLSIRAVGDGMVADTWHIGTFNAAGDNTEKLACLLKADGGSGQADDVVGFFPMSFMYTITICDDCPSP